MLYLVTSRPEVIEEIRKSHPCNIIAVGEPIAGIEPRVEHGDVFYWKSGKKDIQIDEMPFPVHSSRLAWEDGPQVKYKSQYPCIAASKLTVENYVTAAWMQLTRAEIVENLDRLRAIAYFSQGNIIPPPELHYLESFALGVLEFLEREQQEVEEHRRQLEHWSASLPGLGATDARIETNEELVNSGYFAVRTDFLVEACTGYRGWEV